MVRPARPTRRIPLTLLVIPDRPSGGHNDRLRSVGLGVSRALRPHEFRLVAAEHMSRPACEIVREGQEASGSERLRTVTSAEPETGL
jgi:hypothetical protein